MHMGIKILPLTSLPPWKYINKSCWISVNVPTDKACAPLRPAEMPACCFLLSLAGGLLWLPTHDPQTLAVVREMDLSFWCAKFFLSFSFFFSNWINWSNRRLSYPPCHAFYLSLIALSFAASLCLSTSRQYLRSVSLRPFLPLPLSTFYINDLLSLCRLAIWFFLLLFFLPLRLAIVCSWMTAHFVAVTVLFTHWYSKEVLISLPVQSAALILLFQLCAQWAFIQ